MDKYLIDVSLLFEIVDSYEFYFELALITERTIIF